MYNEDSYNHYLTWLKIKRVFFMFFCSIIGCILGVLISSYVVNILMYDSILRIIIITVSTLLFFFISLLSSANTVKQIQNGYWNIAVLRKLTLISEKLDALENLSKLDNLDKLDNLEFLNKLDIIVKALSDKKMDNLITEESNNIEKEKEKENNTKSEKDDVLEEV